MGGWVHYVLVDKVRQYFPLSNLSMLANALAKKIIFFFKASPICRNQSMVCA